MTDWDNDNTMAGRHPGAIADTVGAETATSPREIPAYCDAFQAADGREPGKMKQAAGDTARLAVSPDANFDVAEAEAGMARAKNPHS